MQMGGGDSLYDKIDKGIRNCQVVISCVTSKYSISPNCRREVSLADALKKPIIPLLLEKMTWPPEGPMSMVLTQLLYIDFCSNGIEVQKHWEAPQFDEMLNKIKVNLPADDDAAEEQSKTESSPKAAKNDNAKKEETGKKPATKENGTKKSTQAPPGKASPVPMTTPKSSCCIIQ